MPKYLPLTIILVLGFLLYKLFIKNSPLETINITINNKKFDLEVAKSLNQKSQGLSNRSSLCPNCGMIFIYPKEGIYPFWMKETLIPLDMIWVNKNGIVTDIVTANPEPNTPITKLTLYRNTSPAQYIIELNANQSQEIKLKIGDQIWTNPPVFP